MNKNIQLIIKINVIFVILVNLLFANTSIKSVSATKLNGEKIEIDGRVDETSWVFTNDASQFIQRDPIEGDPASQSTSFSILYDNEHLYIAVKALTDDNSTIKGILSRRDAQTPSDWVYVSIDSYNDNRTAFEFGWKPVGGK